MYNPSHGAKGRRFESRSNLLLFRIRIARVLIRLSRQFFVDLQLMPNSLKGPLELIRLTLDACYEGELDPLSSGIDPPVSRCKMTVKQGGMPRKKKRGEGGPAGILIRKERI